MNTPVPVHILCGFLGSGKTTLLTAALDYYTLQGKKPAVLMNELGDVNLDGMLVNEAVPMSEMLSGCICCTIRGDLGMELKQLIDEHRPDVIFVECTGAANPIEILDGVTDASLLTELELKTVVTVIDAGQLSERSRTSAGKTYRLMQEQIRCGTRLVLNKSDVVTPEELSRLEQLIRGWNPDAPLDATVRCAIDLSFFERGGRVGAAEPEAGMREMASCGCGHSHSHGGEGEEACGLAGGNAGPEPSGQKRSDREQAHHHSHDHVMVYTHYFDRPIDSEQFEALVGSLPPEIFRAKGILRFTDTAGPFLFQYAYREMDFVRIAPKQEVPHVAVFIGERFDRQALAERLSAL
ncbi:CobW family GTP-binding protein [Paenibacillus ginsengihumi]|uniref:CobW family GTP-binding protein n=1 Tax=Paenibacillus ginsengihumi TaxID=431596 RepID=UPI0003806CFE|nr:GTP-binding protein [Paenibacillus ginsengihumi]